MTVFEFMITDRHGVIAHRDHELKGQPSFSKLGQRPGEDIPGIKQEDIGLGLPDVLDERRHFGNATNYLLVFQPEGRDRVVSALDIVGEEQGDGCGLWLYSLYGRLAGGEGEEDEGKESGEFGVGHRIWP